MTVPTTGPFSSPRAPGAVARMNSNWSPSTHAPQLIHHHHPIAIAIERQPHLGAHARHRQLQQFRRGGAAAIIDVAAVGRTADGHDLRAQIGEHPRRHLVAGAVGAIDDDLEALQVHAGRNGRGAKLLILRAAAVDAHRLAQVLRLLRDHRLRRAGARSPARRRRTACCRWRRRT